MAGHRPGGNNNKIEIRDEWIHSLEQQAGGRRGSASRFFAAAPKPGANPPGCNAGKKLIMNKKTPTSHQGHAPNKPAPMEMQLLISNGQPAQDARLKFEFPLEAPGTPRVWIVKLPPLKNPDVFPRQLTPEVWELRLDAVGATQPLHVRNYTAESAGEWLAEMLRPRPPAPTELLILAHHRRFTVTNHQPLL